MADLAFEDLDGYYYIVDVKTHRLSTKFNMPNLTSVERLARFYEDDKNYFVVLMDVSRGPWKKNGALHSVIRVSDQAATSACSRTSLRRW